MPDEMNSDRSAERELTKLLQNSADVDGNLLNELRVRNYAEQPDGDIVGRNATGEAFRTKQTLGENETFTSEWFDTDGYSSFQLMVVADQESANDGVVIEYTGDANVDNPVVDSKEVRRFTRDDAEDGFAKYSFHLELDGLRVKYTNNGTAGNVKIVGTLRQELSFDGADYVDQDKYDNNFIRVGTAGDKDGISIKDPTSLFGDLNTIQRTSVIDLTSSFGTSAIRDEITSTGSGIVTEDPDPATGEVELSTGTTADSSITVTTAEYGRYTPGYSAQFGAGIRIPSLPTEGDIKWGYFDDSDGFYWGYDGDQQELYAARLKDGVEVTKVYVSDMNGADFPKVTDKPLDPTNGYIFQINFAWYGYGIINFEISTQTEDDGPRNPEQITIPMHSLVVENETSTTDPNQPLRIEAENGANGEDVRVRFGGRQFSVLGNLPSDQRITAATVEDTTVDADAWTHVMSWRRKEAAADPNARLTVKDIDFALDQTCRVALIQGANLSGTNFVTPDLVNPDETLVEVSKDGTFEGLDGGTKTFEASLQVAGTGTAQDTLSPDVSQRFGQNIVVSLIAQGIGGAGSGISTMRISEDW